MVLSKRMSTQRLLHEVSPNAQTHAPFAQPEVAALPLQTLLQTPQLLRSV